MYDAFILYCRLHRFCELGLHVAIIWKVGQAWICHRLASRYPIPNVLWFGPVVQVWIRGILLGREQLRGFPLHLVKCCKCHPLDHLWPLSTSSEDPYVHHCLPSYSQNILFLEDFPLTDSNRSHAYKCHLGLEDLPLILHNFDLSVFLTFRGSWTRKCSIENRSRNTKGKRWFGRKLSCRL